MMEQSTNNTVNKAITVTKMLGAEIDFVWSVWTNPEHIANWWGPNGFTNTIHKMNVVVGGEWRLTMHDINGKNFANKSIFLEIEPFKKIVFQHFNPNYIATVIFEQKEKETLLEWTVVFETPELFETVVKVFKADEGLNQNVEKLDNYLKNRK